MQIPTTPQEMLPLGIAALINIIISVLFCRSLIKTLSYVSEENRELKPGFIWLLLVPGLNYIINFFVVFGMSKSIYNELTNRDFETEENPALASGLVFSVLSLFAMIFMFFPIPESFAVLVAVVGFSQIFFFVQYWMKINWYKNVLENDEEESTNGAD